MNVSIENIAHKNKIKNTEYCNTNAAHHACMCKVDAQKCKTSQL